MILKEKQQKYDNYRLEKLININILQVKKSDLKRVIEQPKFTYSPLEKALEKQTKAIEDQGKKPIKAFGKHGKTY